MALFSENIRRQRAHRNQTSTARRLRVEPLEERALLSTTLVNSNHTPNATIVVAQQPTTAAAYAAIELQQDIKQMTGAALLC